MYNIDNWTYEVIFNNTSPFQINNINKALSTFQELNYQEHLEEINNLFDNIEDIKSELGMIIIDICRRHLINFITLKGIELNLDNHIPLDVLTTLSKVLDNFHDIDEDYKEYILNILNNSEESIITNLSLIIEELTPLKEIEVFQIIEKVSPSLIERIKEDLTVNEHLDEDQITLIKLKELFKLLPESKLLNTLGDINVNNSLGFYLRNYYEMMYEPIDIVIALLLSRDGREDPISKFNDRMLDVYEESKQQEMVDSINLLLEKVSMLKQELDI